MMRLAQLLPVVLLCAFVGLAATARDFDLDTWMLGADGMVEALEAVNEEARPLVVYFYTDWCHFCRQFEKELLGTSSVKEYLSSVLAVAINPEAGATEREIAEYYGVSGYPGFFVHGGRSRTLSRVDRMVLDGGRPRMMAPREFIDACRSAAAK